jgi:hypothetical protein
MFYKYQWNYIALGVISFEKKIKKQTHPWMVTLGTSSNNPWIMKLAK